MGVKKRERKLKSGKRRVFWEAEVYNKGIQVASRSFDSPAKAYAWFEDQERMYKNPKFVKAEMGFALALKKYFDYMQVTKKKQTVQVNMARFELFQRSPLARLDMEHLTPVALDEFLEWAKADKTADTRCRISFDQELRRLRAFFNWYRDNHDYAFKSPLMKRHWELSKYRPQKTRKRDYYMPAEDVLKWLNYLETKPKNPVYFWLAKFMIYTGLRVGEACGLRWSRVDLRNRKVTIDHKIWWDFKTRAPNPDDSLKTEGSARTLPIAESIRDLLMQIPRSSEYVFHGKNGSPLRYPAIQNAFNNAFVALEMPWRSTHICRHTNATLGLIATRDLGGVQAMLGHANQSQTELYAKVVALLDSKVPDATARLLDTYVDTGTDAGTI